MKKFFTVHETFTSKVYWQLLLFIYFTKYVKNFSWIWLQLQLLDTFTCIHIVTKSTGLSNKQWNEGSTSSSGRRLPLVYNFGGRQICKQNATQGEHQKLKLQSLLIKLTIIVIFSTILPSPKCTCTLRTHLSLSEMRILAVNCGHWFLPELGAMKPSPRFLPSWCFFSLNETCVAIHHYIISSYVQNRSCCDIILTRVNYFSVEEYFSYFTQVLSLQ